MIEKFTAAPKQEPNLERVQTIERIVREMEERHRGTLLWNDIDLQRSRQAVSGFDYYETARLINLSGKDEEIMQKAMFYAALLERLKTLGGLAALGDGDAS